MVVGRFAPFPTGRCIPVLVAAVGSWLMAKRAGESLAFVNFRDDRPLWQTAQSY